MPEPFNDQLLEPFSWALTLPTHPEARLKGATNIDRKEGCLPPIKLDEAQSPVIDTEETAATYLKIAEKRSRPAAESELQAVAREAVLTTLHDLALKEAVHIYAGTHPEQSPINAASAQGKGYLNFSTAMAFHALK